MMKFYGRLAAFLRSIYVLKLDQCSLTIPILGRQRNDLYCPPLFFKLQSNSSLVRCEKTCLTGSLENKRHIIFVLVLYVICTLWSVVG